MTVATVGPLGIYMSQAISHWDLLSMSTFGKQRWLGKFGGHLPFQTQGHTQEEKKLA